MYKAKIQTGNLKYYIRNIMFLGTKQKVQGVKDKNTTTSMRASQTSRRQDYVYITF